MDKKHNIRNMSVIAHVDHVSARTRYPAPFPGAEANAGSRVPIEVGFGLGGSFPRERDERDEEARASAIARHSIAMHPRAVTSSIPAIVRALA